jgi:hypothetical protein
MKAAEAASLRGVQRRSNLDTLGLAGSGLLRCARNDTWETDMVITKEEETLGPIAPLYRFKTDDEAVKMANENPHPSLPRLRGRVRRWLAAHFQSRGIDP